MDPRGTSTVDTGSPFAGLFSLPEAFFKTGPWDKRWESWGPYAWATDQALA